MFVDSFLKLVRSTDVVKTLLFAILIDVVKANAYGVSIVVPDDRKDGLALRLKCSLKGLSA